MEERTIEVPSIATVAEAAALAISLSEAIVEDGPYVIRAGKLSRIDGAGLQALTAFKLTAEALGWPVRWEGVSDSLTAAAKATGLTSVLGLDGPKDPH